jgi:ACS family hexuronate transporter-like MFS transporter
VLLRQRAVWGLLLARFLSDPVWYFYLFWLPDYMQRERGLSLAEVGFYGWIPFLFADLGSIGGGYLSDRLVRRGVEPARARLYVLAGVGLLAPLGAAAGVAPTLATTIGVTCLVAALTQCWSANTATLAADLAPNEATATVFGMMGTAGSLAGAGFAQLLGVVIGQFGYPAAFALAACMHPLAAVVLWKMVGKKRIVTE